MSNQRTVLVESINYLGTDGEDHVAVRGDKITVAAAGVEHFDWVHDASPEAKWAAYVKDAESADKSAKAAAAPKAAEKS